MKEAPGNEREPAQNGWNENDFDSFARHAAASLRSAPPENGMANVVRQGNRRQTRRLAVEVGAVVALVVAGVVVATRSDHSTNVDVPPVPTTQTTVSPVPTSTVSDAEISQWFLDYTGNPGGPATGEPVKFGIVTNTFSYTYALEAAAAYLNAQSGGVGGRPIELDVCKQPLSECADRYASNPAVVAVLENTWNGGKSSEVVFADSIADSLAGRKPLHESYSDTGTSAIAYYPIFSEAAAAMALEAEKLTVPGQRVLVIGGAGRSTGIASILEGRDVVEVSVSESETLADAIRRVGATDVAAVVLAAPAFAYAQAHAPQGGLLCDDFTNAIDELRMKAAVIATTCGPRDGWYKVDVGLNETSPTLESGALSIGTKIHTLGATSAGPPTRDLREIGALLAMIRIINGLGGPTNAPPEALDQAMRNFTGPLPLGAGPLDCSPTGKLAQRVAPGSCVRFVDVHQFVHEQWIDLAPIDLGS